MANTTLVKVKIELSNDKKCISIKAWKPSFWIFGTWCNFGGYHKLSQITEAEIAKINDERLTRELYEYVRNSSKEADDAYFPKLTGNELESFLYNNRKPIFTDFKSFIKSTTKFKEDDFDFRDLNRIDEIKENFNILLRLYSFSENGNENFKIGTIVKSFLSFLSAFKQDSIKFHKYASKYGHFQSDSPEYKSINQERYILSDQAYNWQNDVINLGLMYEKSFNELSTVNKNFYEFEKIAHLTKMSNWVHCNTYTPTNRSMY